MQQHHKSVRFKNREEAEKEKNTVANDIDLQHSGEWCIGRLCNCRVKQNCSVLLYEELSRAKEASEKEEKKLYNSSVCAVHCSSSVVVHPSVPAQSTHTHMKSIKFMLTFPSLDSLAICYTILFSWVFITVSLLYYITLCTESSIPRDQEILVMQIFIGVFIYSQVM